MAREILGDLSANVIEAFREAYPKRRLAAMGRLYSRKRQCDDFDNEIKTKQHYDAKLQRLLAPEMKF